MNRSILSTITIFLVFAGSVIGSSFDREFVQVKTGTAEGVIVPDSLGSEFYKVVTGAGGARIAELYWTPATEDVMRAEDALVAYLKESGPQASPDLWKKLPQYYRQYVGLGCSCRGDKRLWINFIHKDYAERSGTDWKKKPVRASGGGDLLFNVTYNTRTGAFSDLSVNGAS